MLIDVSATLSDDHAQIKSLSSIGFGTFVDKSTTPFYSPRAPLRDGVIDFCYSNAIDCVPSYSYRHALSLTNNNTLFAVSACTSASCNVL